jgi:cystinosin
MGMDRCCEPFKWKAWLKADLSQIYTIGYIKLVVTFVKYMPQVWVNYKRKSTQGWSIWQILFDLTGGVLSILQLVIDSSLQADWSGITGNSVKLGLGNVSIFFDLIFIMQHYFLYTTPEKLEVGGNEDGSRQPLLGGQGGSVR